MNSPTDKSTSKRSTGQAEPTTTRPRLVDYDLAVIGGGPAGMMAAGRAVDGFDLFQNGAKVVGSSADKGKVPSGRYSLQLCWTTGGLLGIVYKKSAL